MRLIDADYAQKELNIAEVECGKNFQTDCSHVRDFLNALPTIDAVPVAHARWIMRGGRLYCSNCNQRACVTRDSDDFWYTAGTDYCPSCGAKMKQEG